MNEDVGDLGEDIMFMVSCNWCLWKPCCGFLLGITVFFRSANSLVTDDDAHE